MKSIWALVLLSTAGLFISCGDDGSQETSNFDRAELLTSLADELIIPNLEKAQVSVNALEGRAVDFVNDANESNLLMLREAWIAAVLDYQHTSAFWV